MSARIRCAALVALVVPAIALAQSSGGPYTLRKQTVATGGGRASGGAFVLVATIGQHVAGASQGGSSALTAGFHGPQPAAAGDSLFGNGFE